MRFEPVRGLFFTVLLIVLVLAFWGLWREVEAPPAAVALAKTSIAALGTC